MAHSAELLEQLSKQIEEAKTKVEVGAEYVHFKNPNRRYEVVSIGVLESTNEIGVVYRPMFKGGLIWIRTLEDFTSKVKLENGKEVDRFTKVG